MQVVNDPTVIAQNHAFVSINGALSVDLYGQVVADNIEGRQISGVGGHEDFVAGAEMRIDDHSLICLRSTAVSNGVTRSRIVPFLPEGAVVSTPRHHTGVVITEYGAADLSGRTVRERAIALAEIAHPDFRDGLRGDGRRPSGATDPVDGTGPGTPGVAPTGPGGRATLRVASFNVHMGVDGWGRPFDLVAECAGARRRRPGPAGGLDPRRRVARARRPGGRPPSGYGVVAEAPSGPRPPLRAAGHRAPRGGRPLLGQVRKTLRLDDERFKVPAGSRDRAALHGRWGVALLARVPCRDAEVLDLGKLRRDPARRAVIRCTTDLGGPRAGRARHPHVPHHPPVAGPVPPPRPTPAPARPPGAAGRAT